MKSLIVEDDFTSRFLLQELLKTHGEADVAVNGFEAVAAVRRALDAGAPYHLICLDIMMPFMDGQEVLRHIRNEEADRSLPPVSTARIVMTTALKDVRNVSDAYYNLCDAYLVKPIDKARLLGELHRLDLI